MRKAELIIYQAFNNIQAVTTNRTSEILQYHSLLQTERRGG